ncbi:MAG: hypothetical protein LKG21_07995 [Ruminococcus sp.]|jgi:hypothetical protein|nr:hypothetical protein [Ruminococcus sp.]
MKFDYNICNQADEEIFNKQCKALEKHIPNLIKLDMLTDVDGSKIQRYELNGKKIVVYNHFVIDAVFIKSDVDIEQYFS